MMKRVLLFSLDVLFVALVAPPAFVAVVVLLWLLSVVGLYRLAKA